MVTGKAASTQRERAKTLPSWELTPDQLCDLELLISGGYFPLRGYLCRNARASVLATMSLPSGEFWPVPISLEVSVDFSSLMSGVEDAIALRDQEGVLLAVMDVEEKWPSTVGQSVFLGGPVHGLERPTHYDFPHLYLTPEEMRIDFQKSGWSRVMAVAPGHAMHRPHVLSALEAARQVDSKILIHYLRPPDAYSNSAYFGIIRALIAVLKEFPDGQAMLVISPYSQAQFDDDPYNRNLLLRAIIHRNMGCSYFEVDTPWDDNWPVPGITPVVGPNLSWSEPANSFISTLEKSATPPLGIAEVQSLLREKKEIPSWFSFHDVIAELRRCVRTRDQQGVTIFFTGLSGAGKSTIANALMLRLLEISHRTITVLDGDKVRKNLSSELGFSREHRDLNILRIGYVASEITKHGGIAICAPIAPYRETRRKVRQLISSEGGFFEVYVATPITVCESRDRKGLYAKARAGIIKEFTGVSDPYEAPEQAELVIDTQSCTVLEAVERIQAMLEEKGYI